MKVGTKRRERNVHNIHYFIGFYQLVIVCTKFQIMTLLFFWIFFYFHS